MRSDTNPYPTYMQFWFEVFQLHVMSYCKGINRTPLFLIYRKNQVPCCGVIPHLENARQQVREVLQQGCVALVGQHKGGCCTGRQGADLEDDRDGNEVQDEE